MASSLTFDSLTEVFNGRRLAEIFRSHRTAILSTLGVAVALPVAINDYRTYISYGPGGLPYNVGGWLAAHLLRVFSREQLSTVPYDNKQLLLADEPGFLPSDFPPKRSSSRPRIGPHPVPQRQLEQLPSDEVRQKLIRRFAELGERAQQMGLVDVKRSLYERQHVALFVAATREWHGVARETRGEISHVHAGLDGSIHVVLHPADCKKVIERGWGQRHAFSGAAVLRKLFGFSLPVNYVLVYAPRDEAEVDVTLSIVTASIQFMTGTRAALE
ncbi:hypothetical protein BU26DRAFT_44128 [Trematosphaeria pertusa]|uniref:Luciferase domain-containing protein n=1 Tax=Trematosphaeria pertusa TaxID=390896 RepID=A0A6A6J3Q4_9PLEO|nr:uncharacterized protein BU26DRAFT_44128 [Trematosphaeria pertusa]KAF2257455.1 hypothetical protein BU26DRAFT_44128 [Trematosphaeria pertusa]